MWYQALALAGGIGALVWGAAADFFSVRWLLIALAVLSLPAAAWVWLSDDPVGAALLLSLVRGGLISLPWVLTARLLPKRHFGKLALAIVLLGVLGSSLGSLYQGAAMVALGKGLFIWIALIESIVLAAAVAWATDGRKDWQRDTVAEQAAPVRRPGAIMKRRGRRTVSGNLGDGQHRRPSPASSVSPAPTPGIPTGRTTMERLWAGRCPRPD